MDSLSLRQRFLNYFEQHGHRVIPSSSLVPEHDQSLLFTNAGMNQFKDWFLGYAQPPFERVTTVQRCVRAGGKHNDLDNVGYTARHHTFFEMMGNFSFGAYFKQHAIELAWRFLTLELQIPVEKLWVTVFESDQESADIWLHETELSPDHLRFCGEEDNFWSMGETGPCGPCTEIFYDHGPSISGGPPGSVNQSGDRYIEIWNLVFMQYERHEDGQLTPLPKPCVDTGLGFERLAAVLQGVHSNYDTDLFQPLIQFTHQHCPDQAVDHPSLKVLADHIRSAAFLIADGVLPSPEGRGYVLRRIIRRAIRHAHQLGLPTPFLHQLLPVLQEIMARAYPILKDTEARQILCLKQEEQQFMKTLAQGLNLFKTYAQDLKPGQKLSGESAFKLYDTYGFPLDLSVDLAKELNCEVDLEAFQHCMQKQQALSARAQHWVSDQMDATWDPTLSTLFTGYDHFQQPHAQVIALFKEGLPVTTIHTGDKASIVLDKTSFYAESGGQVGDSGTLRAEEAGGAVFEVKDTLIKGQAFLHEGVLCSGRLDVGDTLLAEVDATRRRAIMRSHSATHLLHAALRQCLGEHVVQKGSLVEPDRLRFDFAHDQALTLRQSDQIEALVNRNLLINHRASLCSLTLAQAQASGALALFGEKYQETVRVLAFGEFSKECCGGTHVTTTSEIGFFRLTHETGIAAGIRRIEAVTGNLALARIQEQTQWHREILAKLNVSPDQALVKIAALQTVEKQWRKTLEVQQKQAVQAFAQSLKTKAKTISDFAWIAAQLPEPTWPLKSVFDALHVESSPLFVVLWTVQDATMRLLIGMSPFLTKKLNRASDFLSYFHITGGGRPHLAEGGGSCPKDMQTCLNHLERVLR